MKYVFILLFLFFPVNALASTYADAIKQAKKEKKELLLIFTSDNCVYCEKLKFETILPLEKELEKSYLICFCKTEKNPETVQLYVNLPGQWAFDLRVPTYYITKENLGMLNKKGVGFKNLNEFRKWIR